ncbi:MAG: M48 family metallopeptidase [Myxococcota bacterium]
MDIGRLRHGKENFYGTASLIVGTLGWLVLLVVTMGGVLLFGVFALVSLFIAGRMLRAALFGGAVQVTERQFPKVHAILQESARAMGVAKLPTMFVLNSHGITNAVAVKVLSGRYILLYSELIDLLHEEDGDRQLRMIIAHELAHHRAGHLNIMLNTLRVPAMILPSLGGAYSRAREYTADRIAAACVGDKVACQRALMALALGSDVLRDEADIEQFKQQEKQIPGFFGYFHELLSTHPRMTRRVAALDRLFEDRRLIAASPGVSASSAPMRDALPAR